MKDLIKELMSYCQCSTKYEETLKSVTRLLPSSHKEELINLNNNGPVYDGDVISKVIRDDLLEWGFASRAMIKGNSGYTVANYRGFDLFKAWEE